MHNTICDIHETATIPPPMASIAPMSWRVVLFIHMTATPVVLASEIARGASGAKPGDGRGANLRVQHLDIKCPTATYIIKPQDPEVLGSQH